MSLSFGPQIIAIPGPTPVPDRVLRSMHRASPDIYAEDLAALNVQVMHQLKRLAGTTANLAPYIGNGHVGWEAAAANLFNRGDKVLVLVSGFFGRSWALQLREMGIDAEEMDFGAMAPDPDRLTARLAQDRDHRIRAVMVCQTDTASSVAADIRALRRAMELHPALFVVDAIASLGCAAMKMDDWGVDVLIAASQKGLMCPPGAAFNWFSERAASIASSEFKTPTWDWRKRAKAAALWEFWGGTPPVQLVFGLNESLQMILDEQGLDAVWSRHAALARAVWAAAQAWGKGNDAIRLTVPAPAMRSVAVTAMAMPQADALRQWTSSNIGVTLGIGLGAADPASALRVAHMGHCNAAMVLGSLGAMQAGMNALAIPHGSGALDAAAAVIAELA